MSNDRKADVERFAGYFQALSNPNRLRIFLRLVSCRPPGRKVASQEGICACVGELGRDLGIVPSTVSHHIKELRQAGLIRMQRNGQNIECSVERSALDELAGFLEQQKEKANERQIQ